MAGFKTGQTDEWLYELAVILKIRRSSFFKKVFYDEIQFTYHQKLISLFYVDFGITLHEKSMFISICQTRSVFVTAQKRQSVCSFRLFSERPYPLSFIDTQHRKQQTKLETEVKSVNKKHITTFTFQSFTSKKDIPGGSSESISAQN